MVKLAPLTKTEHSQEQKAVEHFANWPGNGIRLRQNFCTEGPAVQADKTEDGAARVSSCAALLT